MQYNGLDDCVAAWGILMYHLDCCCSEHLPFWDCWLAAQCSRAFHDLRLHLPVLCVVTCLSVLFVRGSLQGNRICAERLRSVA